jgi:hypothetical protein
MRARLHNGFLRRNEDPPFAALRIIQPSPQRAYRVTFKGMSFSGTLRIARSVTAFDPVSRGAKRRRADPVRNDLQDRGADVARTTGDAASLSAGRAG